MIKILLLELTARFFYVWQLGVSRYWVPSLYRSWVCNLLVQLLPGLPRSVTLGLKFTEFTTILDCLI
jgi:hypothetical protein